MDNCDYCSNTINNTDVNNDCNAKEDLNLGGCPPNWSNGPLTCADEPFVGSGLGRREVPIPVVSDCAPLLQAPFFAHLLEEPPMDMGNCEVNMVNLNDTSLVNNSAPTLPPLGADVNDEVALNNIPISIVFNDVMLAEFAIDNGLIGSLMVIL